jgi:hypothetical protein
MRIVPGITAMNPMDLHHMPYTHSLLGAALWAAAFGLLVGFGTRRREAAIGAAIVVLSHWFLDLIVHIPDLTLFGAPPKLGLGLWNHPLAEMPLEILLTGSGCSPDCSRWCRRSTGSGRRSRSIRSRSRPPCSPPMRCWRVRHGGRARIAHQK